MRENSNPLQGILDIESPAIPVQLVFEQHALEIVFVVFLILGALLGTSYLMWRHYFSIRGKAKRRLARLKKNVTLRQINNHEAVFQLSSILRSGLCLQQISKNSPLPNKVLPQHIRWARFLDELSIARYSVSQNKTSQVQLLLGEANYWLRLWPLSINVSGHTYKHD